MPIEQENSNENLDIPFDARKLPNLSDEMYQDTMSMLEEDIQPVHIQQKKRILTDEADGSNKTMLMKLAGAMTALTFLASSCSTPAQAEVDTSTQPIEDTIDKPSPTPTEIPTPTMTPIPELEIPEVDNSWTYEEMDKFLEDWRYGLKESVDARRPDKPFYYYVASNEWGGGYFHDAVPYGKGETPQTILEYMPSLSEEVVVDKQILDQFFKSIFFNINRTNFDPENKYDAVIYLTKEEDEYGEYNGFYLKDGGFFRVHDETRVRYIPPDNLERSYLTEQEIEWINQGYTIFDYRFGENGVGRGKDPRGENFGDDIN